MKSRKITEKVNAYNEITELLVKENDYLHIMKGYCSNEMDSSDIAARALILIDTLCNIHEALYKKIDDLIIDTGL